MAKYKIAIDAGHGSQTAGKRTPDGYKEHWINVRHAYYFEKAAKRCGFDTVRVGWDDTNAKDDSDMTILARQKAIRAAGVDASVSWHANAYEDDWNSANGVESIIHSVSSKRKDSRALATLVQAELIKGTEQKNRGVKTGNFGVCNATYMRCEAAILIESGFMTNSREAELLKTDKFCQEQAEDACRGVCKYFGVDYIEHGEIPEKEVSTAPEYKVGTVYTLQVELKVRKGPGTTYAAKKHSELTSSGQVADQDKDGCIDASTRVTCQEVTTDAEGNIWIRIPSGWIAAYYKGREFVK